MPKPSPSTYYGYFQRYINLVVEDDLITALTNQTDEAEKFLNSISEEKSTYAYAEGKWSIKEMLQHITDTERVFSYRALCIARGEQQPLPGFEENDYAANSYANNLSWQQLIAEFLAVRKSTILMFEGFNDAVLDNAGIASNNPVTVASLGFTTVGHYAHHKKVLVERYL